MKKHMLLGLCGIIFASFSATAAYINVGELDLDFCNGGNKLDIKMDAGTSTGFCVRLTNLSIKTGTVQIGLVDGEMSEGAHPVQACKTDTSGIFGQSAMLFGDNTFVLKPEESIVKTGIIALKTGFVGVMHGCTVFTIIDDGTPQQSGQMFSIITRKANTISVTVSGEVKTDVAFGAPTLTANADGSYTLDLSITNKGTVNTEIIGSVDIQGGIGKDLTDRLGLPTIMPYNRTIPLNTMTIYPGDTKNITMQLAGLPRYGGSYIINGNLTNTPVVDATIKLPSGAHTFTTSWIFGLQKYGIRALLAATLIALIILIWIIYMLIRLGRHSRKKKHGGEPLSQENPIVTIPAAKKTKASKKKTDAQLEADDTTAPATQKTTRKKKPVTTENTDSSEDEVPATPKKRTRKKTPTTESE